LKEITTMTNLRTSSATIIGLIALGSGVSAFHSGAVLSGSRAFVAQGKTSRLILEAAGDGGMTGEPLTGMSETIKMDPSKTFKGVDMNIYNVDYDTALEQWSADVHVPSSFMEEGIYLGARDKSTYFADFVTVDINRDAYPDAGLGIGLLEIAGGRGDGVGITIVENLVQGGNAEASTVGKGSDNLLVSGDAIVALQLLEDTSKEPLGEAVSVEALDYDGTVNGILQLPTDWQNIRLTLKRLRRKPKVQVKLQYPPEMNEEDMTLELFAGENLRRAMLTRGVKLNDKFSRRFDSGGTGDCGAEGTCATCVISVTNGADLLNKQSIQEEQILAKNPRWRLACRAIVGYGSREGSLTLRVNPRQW
jgi:ferredoxin